MRSIAERKSTRFESGSFAAIELYLQALVIEANDCFLGSRTSLLLLDSGF